MSAFICPRCGGSSFRRAGEDSLECTTRVYIRTDIVGVTRVPMPVTPAMPLGFIEEPVPQRIYGPCRNRISAAQARRVQQQRIKEEERQAALAELRATAERERERAARREQLRDEYFMRLKEERRAAERTREEERRAAERARVKRRREWERRLWSEVDAVLPPDPPPRLPRLSRLSGAAR